MLFMSQNNCCILLLNILFLESLKYVVINISHILYLFIYLFGVYVLMCACLARP